MELLQGEYIGNERGFGFVKIAENEPDIFISKKDKKDALNGDVVEIKIINKNSGEHKEGTVIKVIKRNTTQVVGTFEKSKNFGFVVPDDNKLGTDIFVPKSSFGKAKNHQKVVVKITKYPKKGMKAEGKIIEVLGNIDEAGVDMLSVIKEYGLNNEFSKEVIKEAKTVSQMKISLEGRKDFRKNTIFTIDGEDAKDLDDAVGVKKNKDGAYTLEVHIADVSNYVKEGSKLNEEAIKRGTSVYMMDRVIPMLPKELSNGACSLNENEDRYALSVIISIDKNGNVLDSDIYKSVIKVTKRMSYKEVQEILDGKNIEIINKYKEYIKDFKLMEELAKILKNRRMKNGYLALEIPESKITLDKNGIAIDVKAYENTFANEIIEQFMLTANETADEDKVKELNKYLYNLGYKIKGKLDEIKPTAFSKILEDVKGKEEEKVVANLLLRTLKVARYEAENKGHFGISSKYYCHFTSPIRRYPDLFIHRIISKYIDNGYNVKEETKEKYFNQAEKYSRVSSENEQIATKAERTSEDIKKAEYMQNKIGNEYYGITSSITSFGIFVELENTIEGLVRLTEMNDDYYIYDDINKILVGKEKKKVYKLGQKVKIEVIYADKQTRKIDFKLIDDNES